MKLINVLAIVGLLFIFWDGSLHLLNLSDFIWLDRSEHVLQYWVPWILYPRFSNAFVYNVFWACVHIGAASAITVKLWTRN